MDHPDPGIGFAEFEKTDATRVRSNPLQHLFRGTDFGRRLGTPRKDLTRPISVDVGDILADQGAVETRPVGMGIEHIDDIIADLDQALNAA